MVASFVAAALRHRIVVLLVGAAILAIGLYTVRQAPLDVFPEFAPPIVEIQTEAPGLAVEDVESIVTTRIEQALGGLPEIAALRSSSTSEFCVVYVVFPYGTDPYRARQLVLERLALVTELLPHGVHPAVAPLSSALTTILAIGLRARGDMSPMELRDLADWTIRPRLLAVSGVSNVVVYGGRVRQIQVTTSSDRLLNMHASLDDLVQTVEGAGNAAGSGFLDYGGQRLTTWLDSRARTARDIAQAAVGGRDGTQIPLTAVADVAEGPAVSVGDAVINGEPGVLMLVIKQPDVNVPAVTAAVEEALGSVMHSLPAGVQVDPALFRTAGFIEHAMTNLRRALLSGAALVMIVLLLFLGHLRATLISVIAIPLSLLTAVIVLRAFDMTLNIMVLGGLAIAVGEVVDDAIIDVENAWRRLRAAPPGADAREVVLHASVEVRSAVVYATLMVGLVFLPVFLLGGLEGALFRPLASAYVLSTAASLAVALTITPVLAFLLLPSPNMREATPPRLMLALRRGYESLLRRAIARPSLVVALSALLVVVGVALLPWLQLEFLPEFHETNFVMHMTGAPGVGLGESARVGMHAARAMLAVDGVKSVAQQIGRANLSEDVWGAERSELVVQLAADADAEKVTEELRRRAAAIAGFAFDLKQFLNERIEELLEGTGAALVVRLRGPNLVDLEAAAQMVSRRVAAVPGATNVHAPGALSAPGVRIRPRREDLLRFGVSAATLERVLRSTFGGLPVGRLMEGGRQADIVVRLSAPSATDPVQLARLPVVAARDRVIPLSAVADVDTAAQRASIGHDGGVRTLVVRVDVQGRSLEAVAEDVARTVAEVTLPAGVYAEVGGEYKAARAARNRLIGFGALALLGIFALLLIDFGTPQLAALTIINVPLAFVGGIAAVLLGAGGTLSLGAIVGFVTVFGITIRNGIVLIAHFRQVEAERSSRLDAAAIVHAAADRLAPILMTALVTGIALLPLLLLRGRAGGEIEQPMALVIAGGLFTSTWLNLFVVPAWYSRVRR